MILYEPELQFRNVLLTLVSGGIDACFVSAFKDDIGSKILNLHSHVNAVGIII